MPNFRHAFRTLFKSPFVTTIAALSLALGIGANSAIFSLFNELLLRPLDVPKPTELVNLSAVGPKPGSQSCSDAGSCDVVFSYPMFRDLEKSQTVLTGLAAHKSFGTNLSFRGQSLSTSGAMVSGSYFNTLGLHPALGRLISDNDDRGDGGGYVAVISYEFWQKTFGSDSSIINQTITVNGHPMTVIGVAPRDFKGTTIGDNFRVYVPISMRGEVQPGTASSLTNRRSYWVYVFGRLKPGVTRERAATVINTLYHPIIQSVEAPLQKGMSPKTMEKFRQKNVVVEDGRRGQSTIQSEAKTPLLMLFAVTGIVLLIACANIANLLLSRAATRATEMAVRLSLGATRRHLLVQLLTESCLLALIGGVASLVVAQWTLSAMSQMLPPDASDSLTFSLNSGAIAFAAALSIGTGLLFGLFPALHSTRPALISTLRSGATNLSGSRGATRFRTTLVTAQIALSTALLISSGLFIKSLDKISHVDLGMQIDHIATFAISPQRSGYDSTRVMALYNRLENELKAVPGVTNAGLALVGVYANNSWGNDVAVQGFVKTPDTDANSRYNQISPDYFATLGVPLLAGRAFTASDAVGSTKVAIVNESFAKKFGLLGPGKRPLDVVGKMMSDDGGNDSLNTQIVGIVRNAGYSSVKDSVPPVYFVPYRQQTRLQTMSFYLKSTLPPEQILAQVPKLMRRIDPLIPVEDLRTLPDQVKQNIFLDRMISIMSASFAFLATLLAAIGLYGVLAYSVAQRTNEIGIRVALGANAGRVRMMVLRQVGVMTAIGALIGIAGALALGRAAARMLYQMNGFDPVVFLVSTVLLVAVSLAAGLVPALRASRIDPIRALRYE